MKNAIRIMNKANRLITVNLTIISLVFLFNSCKHDNFDEFVGPGHCPSSKFEYTQPFAVSASSINLSTTALTISATFSEPVSWTVSITGNTSGAKRKYSANSNTVNIVWNGQPGSLIFFQAETVTIELKVACKDALTTSVNVTNTNDFTNFGALISDFDGNGTVPNTFGTPGYVASGWSSYWTTTAPNYNVVTYFGTNTVLNPPQGSKYVSFQGQAGPASWFVGGFYSSIDLSTVSNDPDNVYFNAFLNSNGNTTTLFYITLATPAGPYWISFILDGTPGWKLISFKLSDFVTKNIPKGIPLPEVWIVSQVSFDVAPATAQGQAVDVNMDFVIFTEGGPLYEQ